MATYKTPDVYVEEISLFPPSVAEVETAIPAFIGYTERAQEIGPDDLRNVPTEVTSLLEYEELFGGAPPVVVNTIVLDENNVVSSYDVASSYYMYDSLRLFFKNGGGKCYIVSVGPYSADGSVSKANFDAGLQALSKKDEPTIILFPDAVHLGDSALYTLQQDALKQCNDLMDRVAVFDLLEEKTGDPSFDWKDGYKEFRDKIGINYLKYGAAYTPWLKTNLGLNIRFRDVQDKVERGGQPVGLDTLTDSTDVKGTLTNVENAVSDVNQINTDLGTLKGSSETLGTAYTAAVDAFKNNPATAEFKELFNFIYRTVDVIDNWAGGANVIKVTQLQTLIQGLITTPLQAAIATLIGYDRGANTGLTGTYNLFDDASITIGSSEWNGIFDSASPNHPAANDIFTAAGTTNTERMQATEPQITQIFNQVNAAVSEIVKAADKYESTFGTNLYDSHAVYKNLINKLSSGMTKLPPSGAIAGIYAMVDNARGVWKAPANVSLSSVVGLTEVIDNKDQEDLNVDVVAGKSINAIRAFTGRGTLVWGARTLAGNDNEWRYISVRRFFNMVEESVKKSTYWAVFEPNDANTWIKVKSMIENYLVQKWRDGALAGAKPDQAFFVNVGLGTTMTAQDILEGRMNVEIGMAVVRPAEFIILKFSHKMQES